MANQMMASSCLSESMPQMSGSDVKKALNEVIVAINDANSGSGCGEGLASRPPMKAQLEAVRHMESVFPIVSQILMNVISNYGFAKTGEGVVQFCLVVRHMERMDNEIKRLNDELKTYFLPNLHFKQ